MDLILLSMPRPEEVIPSAAIDAGSWEYEIIQRRIQSRSMRVSFHYRRMRVRFERAGGDETQH